MEKLSQKKISLMKTNSHFLPPAQWIILGLLDFFPAHGKLKKKSMDVLQNRDCKKMVNRFELSIDFHAQEWSKIIQKVVFGILRPSVHVASVIVSSWLMRSGCLLWPGKMVSSWINKFLTRQQQHMDCRRHFLVLFFQCHCPPPPKQAQNGWA